jgi:MerR family copper efflux transcriptional regulator
MPQSADVDATDEPSVAPLMQIGEVAARTDLSIRTIRHWEEMGLIVPTARSAGGFRLYSDEDVARIRLLRFMKPLNFTLEQMRDLLALRDRLAPADVGVDPSSALVWRPTAAPSGPVTARQVARDLQEYVLLAEQRLDRLRGQVAQVEEFVKRLATEAQQGSAAAP